MVAQMLQESQFSHLDGNHLLDICQRLGPLLSKRPKDIVKDDGLIRGAGSGSLLQPLNTDFTRRSLLYLFSQLAQRPNPKTSNQSLVQLVHGRENSSQMLKSNVQNQELYTKIKLGCRTLGHLSAVYCVLFDRSGRFIITGADDLLVKVWDAHSGRLLATLRGASMEITDLDINPENTLLAAGCLDKIVRVWCLQTTAPVAVLSAHSGMITSVRWCPLPNTGDFR
jgi:bromodomain and WD repeat domain containing protein 1/3